MYDLDPYEKVKLEERLDALSKVNDPDSKRFAIAVLSFILLKHLHEVPDDQIDLLAARLGQAASEAGLRSTQGEAEEVELITEKIITGILFALDGGLNQVRHSIPTNSISSN